MAGDAGVVLDFDGVLADTMRWHARAYRAVLEPLGIPAPDAAVFEREGSRSESIIQQLADAAGVPLTGDDVTRLATAKQTAFAAFGVPRLYAGATELLSWLAGRPDALALVTGTRRENLERIMPAQVPLFDVTITQEDYSHDKPHPEPFARAAIALGVAPARLTAVENAPRGVASAVAAGYGRVVAVTSTMPAADLSAAGADIVVPDLAAVRAALSRGTTA